MSCAVRRRASVPFALLSENGIGKRCIYFACSVGLRVIEKAVIAMAVVLPTGVVEYGI